MIGRRRRLRAVAIAAQVGADDGEIPRQRRRRRCHITCVCGWPCRSSSGGPLPPWRTRIVASGVGMRVRVKEGNMEVSSSKKTQAGLAGGFLTHHSRGMPGCATRRQVGPILSAHGQKCSRALLAGLRLVAPPQEAGTTIHMRRADASISLTRSPPCSWVARQVCAIFAIMFLACLVLASRPYAQEQAARSVDQERVDQIVACLDSQEAVLRQNDRIHCAVRGTGARMLDQQGVPQPYAVDVDDACKPDRRSTDKRLLHPNVIKDIIRAAEKDIDTNGIRIIGGLYCGV